MASVRYNVPMSSSTDAAYAGHAAHESGDAIPFYELEGHILELWDHLNDLMLEKALLEAQNALPPGDYFHQAPKALAYFLSTAQPPLTDEELASQVTIAEKVCLEARSTYSLRQSVVEDILIIDPMLKAVHSGVKATPTERYSTL